MEGINTNETKWCCDGLKNSNEHIQYNYKKNVFETGAMIDLGMGGFGNRLCDITTLKECPFCGASLKKKKIKWERHGCASINEASEAIKK